VRSASLGLETGSAAICPEKLDPVKKGSDEQRPHQTKERRFIKASVKGR